MFKEGSSTSETTSTGIEPNQPTIYLIYPNISRPLKQTNNNDDVEQRLPILNETPPMLEEDSSTSETASPGIEVNEPTFYNISPSISRPLSEMTEEEQLDICQKLAIIG